MAAGVERGGLEGHRLLASRGDLFVWHPRLLHGGSTIDDPALTRNSLVTNFWARRDCARGGALLGEAPGGAWLQRPPQTVPSDDVPLTGVERRLMEQAADERAVPAVCGGVPQQPRRSLVDRMTRLVYSRD